MFRLHLPGFGRITLHRLLILALIALLAGTAVAPPTPVQAAAIFTVNSALDAVDANPGDGLCETAVPGRCTLRAAVQEANALPGTDTIILPAGTVTLSLAGTGDDFAATGDLDIRSDIIITGAGADQTVIDGAGLDRIFDLQFGTGDVTISGVTLQNGFGNGIWSDGAAGAIFAGYGELLLVDSAIVNNAIAGGGNSGALYAINTSITIVNSLVAGNSSGIQLDSNSLDAELIVVNSTISGNSGTAIAVTNNSVGLATTNLELYSSTVAGNAGLAVEIITPASTFHMQNSIITDNNGLGVECNGLFDTFSNNLVDDASCTGVASPVTGFDAVLSDNGGPTATHAISAESNAYDAGLGGCLDKAAAPLATDQRGVMRPQAAACDIGAYEAGPIIPFDGLTPSSGPAAQAELQAAYSNNGVDFDFYLAGSTPTINPDGTLLVVTSHLGADMLLNFAEYIDSFSVRYTAGATTFAEMYGYGEPGTAALPGGPVLDAVFDNGPYPKTVTLDEPCMRSAQIEVAATDYTVDYITYRVMTGPDIDGDGILDACDPLVPWVVNSADDVDDGACNPLHCSLREAILAANANPNGATPDEIQFDIPGAGVQTIAPTTLLPTITDAVIIDGTTQPGATPNTLAVGNDANLLIELNGAAFGPGAIALVNDADGSTIRGLVFTDWLGGAVTLQSGAADNTIAGNFIGVDPSGTQARGGLSDAVTVAGDDNTVGGTNPADRNVIAGYFWGMTVILGSGNDILGNYIGTNAAGTAALPNGIGISMTTDNNNIGGSAPGAGNLIVAGIGIELNGSGVFTVNVRGNQIGTDANGNPSLGLTGTTGIVVTGGAGGVRIGGSAGEGNLIAGHADGIVIDNSDSVRIADNVIRDNAERGVVVRGAAADLVDIRVNTIVNNGGLGIDLGDDGVSRNDFFDADSGPNGLQNAPVMQRAVLSGTVTLAQGFINSTPDTDLKIDLYATAACHSSTYGGGETLLDTVSVSTDSAGYATFQTAISPAVPSGTAITALASAGDSEVGFATSEFSRCLIAGPNNDSWVNAYEIALTAVASDTLAGSAEQYLTLPGQSRWFRVPVGPQSKLIVDLTDLPADYDLVLYRDIAARYEALAADPPTDLDALHKLTAEFAPDMFSPDMFSPDMFSPDMFSPDMFSPDMFSPDMFSPDMFSPDMFSPDMFSPDMFSPDMFSPDMFSPDMFSPDMFSPDMFSPDMFSPDMFSPDMFSPDQRYFAGIQAKTAIAVSGFDGTAPETAIANSWNDAGDFYISVSGRNGAFSPRLPFTLNVTVLGGECAGVGTIALPDTSGITPGSLEALILVDTSRMSGNIPALLAQLNDLATAANGVVVDVGQDPVIQTLNQQADTNYRCVYAKNLVAYGVKAIVDAYRTQNPTLSSITVVGNDDVIPFFRYPDQALLANESNYQPPVDDLTASQAALRNGYILSQDTYGAAVEIDRRNTSLPVPQLPVGRLVETVDDIVAIVDAYLSRSGAPIVPQSSLVVGYDFMDDAANAIEEQFTLGLGGGGATQTLIDAATVAPADGWSADDLRTALLDSGRHDLVFLAGHFTAFSALAADYETRLEASEIADSTADLLNTIIFSNGCHSGYNIVNEHGIPNVTIEPDWAQAFARKGATFIGGTGYQYGDTEFIEYSERIYLEFSRELRRGTGAVTVGEALVRAKQVYLADSAELRPLHEKALLVSTLYGLPMLAVDMPGARYNPTPPPSDITATTPVTTDPGLALGLESADITYTPVLSPVVKTLVNAVDDTPVDTVYYTFPGSDARVVNPAEPILPLDRRNVTVPDTALRGVGFRGGSYVDNLNQIPLTGAATTEIRGIHTPFVSPVFFPVQPWDVNYFDRLADSAGGRTTLGLMPVQYRSNSAESLDGTLRVYDSMAFRLFYSDNVAAYTNNDFNVTNIPALAAPPDIAAVTARQDGTDLIFEALIVGDPSAGVQEVWITYTGLPGTTFYGAWASLDLTQDADDSRLWTGTLPLGGNSAADVRYIAQAANGVGLVALAANKGAYYTPDVNPAAPSEPPPGGPPPAPVELTLLAPVTGGEYGTQVTFTALLTSNGSPLADEPVEFGLSSQKKTVRTNAAGEAVVTLTLLDEPTTDTVRVSYAGAAGLATASAGVPFTIAPSQTTLTVQTTTPTFGANGIADLRIALTDGFGRPLREKPVLIVVRDAGNAVVFAKSVITNLFGDARLETAPLATGNYTVSAYFAERVVLPTGVWDTRSPRYLPTVTPDPGAGDPPLALVSNTPPSADAGGPYTVAEGQSIVLSAAASSDPDAGQTLTYAWDLNNIGLYETTGVTVTFFATNIDGPTTAPVRVQVCDAVAECTIGTSTVSVENVPPVITGVTNNGPVDVGEVVTITVSAEDPVDVLTYDFDCEGDGTFETVGSTANAVACVYIAPGTYPAAVRVNDGDATDSAATTVTVRIQAPPTADAGPDLLAVAGVPVTFAGTYDDPTNAPARTITWLFGDGGTATGSLTPSHTYAAPGLYTVSLTVVNQPYQIPASDTLQVRVLPAYFGYCVYGQDDGDAVRLEEFGRTDCNIGGIGKIEIKKDAEAGGAIVSFAKEVVVEERAHVTGSIDATEKVEIKQYATVDGDVVSREEIKLKEFAFVGGDALSAGKIELDSGAVIAGSQSAFDGGIAPLDAITLDAFSVTAGTSDVTVKAGAPEVLAPGSYKKLKVEKSAQVTLLAGDYFFEEIVVEDDGVIAFDLDGDGVIINVRKKVELKQRVVMEVDSADSTLPTDILFLVAGDDVKLDKFGTYVGTFLAPNAHVDLEEGATLTGALYGDKVHVKKSTTLTFAPALELYAEQFPAP